MYGYQFGPKIIVFLHKSELFYQNYVIEESRILMVMVLFKLEFDLK
jgi:hypothetical protein